MESINGYALRVKTSMPFDDALETVTKYLADEGFGVLTEIDVKATMKKKLDVDHKPYKILGACNAQGVGSRGACRCFTSMQCRRDR